MKNRRTALAVLAAIVGFFVLPLAIAVATEFLVFQPKARRLIAALPADEQTLPLNVKKAFAKLEPRDMDIWVSRNLLQDCTKPTGMARWNVRYTLWNLLVPRVYSRQTRESLFAHYLFSNHAYGLEAVSREVFAKHPQQLSMDEALGLIVISKGPRRFSPSENPVRYQEELRKLKAKSGAV